MNRFLLDEVVELMDQCRALGYAKEKPLTLSKATEMFPTVDVRLLKEVVSHVNLQPLDVFEGIA